MRKENSFIDKYKDYNYSDVHIKGSMLYVTTYDGNPWWFDFKRSNWDFAQLHLLRVKLIIRKLIWYDILCISSIMDVLIQFQNEENAKRGQESIMTSRYRSFHASNIYREGSKLYITSNNYNPRWSNNPWGFKFETSILINPIFKLSSNHFLFYLENGDYSDIEIEVKEGDIKEIFYLHRIILSKNSTFFSKSLGGSFKEKELQKLP